MLGVSSPARRRRTPVPYVVILLSFLSTLAPAGAAGGPDGARAEGPPSPVSFYVDAALANNPSLAAMRERIRLKENAAVRAGALDDPKLRLGVTNVPVRTWDFREEDMTGKEVGLSQMFPYPGKLRLRTDIATREKEQTEHDLAEMRNMLRSEIGMTYAELASVRRQAEEVRRSREIVKEIVDITQEMYAVGKVSQADVHRGQIEFEKMREMLLSLENREKVLSIRLNTLAAFPPGQPVPPLAELDEFAFPYRPDELVAMYRDGRPARKALAARVGRGDASVAMARREFYPDLEFSVSYMQRDRMPDGTGRQDMFSSMLMMNLPIWRRGKLEPAVREMEAEREMARRELEALDLASEDGIGRSVASLGNRASLAALYRTTLIPHAEEAFKVNLEAYRVGKIDFPMLMDSIVNVLSFRKDYAGMAGELHMERARLEGVVGRELR